MLVGGHLGRAYLLPVPAVPLSTKRLQLTEQDDIWAGKRYFSEERIAELSKERKPSLPPTPERLEELRETARKAIDASLELADGMETA